MLRDDSGLLVKGREALRSRLDARASYHVPTQEFLDSLSQLSASSAPACRALCSLGWNAKAKWRRSRGQWTPGVSLGKPLFLSWPQLFPLVK